MALFNRLMLLFKAHRKKILKNIEKKNCFYPPALISLKKEKLKKKNYNDKR